MSLIEMLNVNLKHLTYLTTSSTDSLISKWYAARRDEIDKIQYLNSWIVNYEDREDCEDFGEEVKFKTPWECTLGCSPMSDVIMPYSFDQKISSTNDRSSWEEMILKGVSE